MHTPIIHSWSIFLLRLYLIPIHPSIYPQFISFIWKENLFSFLKDIFFLISQIYFVEISWNENKWKSFYFPDQILCLNDICSQHIVDFSDFPLNINPGKKWGKQKLNPGYGLIFYHLHPCMTFDLCVSPPHSTCRLDIYN